MAPLDALRDAVLPGARIVPASGSGGSLEIAWVRVMKPRVPAFDALEPGDLAIVPATALDVVAPGGRELDALVAGLATAGVSGAILVDNAARLPADAAPRSAAPLDALEAALGSAGLATIRTTDVDPAAVERNVIGYLVNRRAELERQAGILEAQLESLALEGAGPTDLVAAIGAFLGRAVALEGSRGGTLAVHAPAGVDEAASAVTRYRTNPRAIALRIAFPPSGGGAASLVLLGERPPSELERVVANRIPGLLALELSRDEAVRRARDDARRSEALPSDGPPWVVLLARQRLPGATDSLEARDAIRRELRLLAPPRAMGLRGDANSLELRVVLAAGAELGSRIAAFLGRTVALSRPFGTDGERPAAEAEARATLEAAERLAEPPRVARADRLAAYRLLGNLHNLPDGARQARTLLEPVLVGRPDVRREHLATLRAVLDHSGPAEAAAALGVHRNTVAYRVRRIEALTGWRLSDPELRLPLALALRLVQKDQD